MHMIMALIILVEKSPREGFMINPGNPEQWRGTMETLTRSVLELAGIKEAPTKKLTEKAHSMH